MTIIFLLDNPFVNDRRVHREAKTLARNGHRVTLFGVQKQGCPAEEVTDGISVRRIFPEDLFNIRKYKQLLAFSRIILREDPEVLHCHDHLMLGLGAEVKRQCPQCTLIYDSHELFHSWPVNLSGSGGWKIFIKSKIVRAIQIYRERRNAKYIDYLITVNKSIAVHLHRYFRLKRKPVVVRNLPELCEVRAADLSLREKFAVPASSHLLVFIGAHIYRNSLNLEQVIGEFGNREQVALVLICGEGSGKREIMKLVESGGYRNIFFHPLVPPADIEAVLSTCDAGLVPTWNKKDLSYWYALDNKLFEYMMAGIPILATRQPEYIEVVEKYGIGVCINPETKEAYYEGFLHIIQNKPLYRAPLEQARNILNWEHESRILTDLYEEIGQYGKTP